MPGKGKPFKKGEGGKPKGAQSKVTKEARLLFIEIMQGQVPNVQTSLNNLKAKDDEKYLNCLSKLFPYFMPKKLDMTTDGEKIQNEVVIFRLPSNER
jgi:hypothetical protein